MRTMCDQAREQLSRQAADGETTLSFTLNGNPVTVTAQLKQRMLDVLRNTLGLTGTKEGCGVGECGACTVVMNDVAVDSCMVPCFQMQDADILTVEGLSQTQIGSTLQVCFVEGDAIQCGFCTPGMLMSAYALLKQNPQATREEIRTAISGNLCRCTGYVPIVNAIECAGWKILEDREP